MRFDFDAHEHLVAKAPKARPVFTRPRHHLDVSRIPRCRVTRSFWGRVWAAFINWL